MTDTPAVVPAPPFASFSPEIYLSGMAGARPELPIEMHELEERAHEAMTTEAWGYVAGGASSEATARNNRSAFERWRIVPRLLTDVSVRDLSTEVLGTPMPAPVLTGPVGVQSIVHPDGELATVRAVAGLGLTSVLSTASSYTLEEVAGAAPPDAPRWFQLYWPRDPDVTASLVSRAEAAGYRALVVTLDTYILGWRPRDLSAAYLPFLQSIGIANYLSDPAFRAGLAKPPEEDPGAAILHFVGMFGDPSKTWEDLADLRAMTSLPIVLKGVQDPDDARRAVDIGADGVIVSNHGGRQVDGAIGSLDALPRVVDAVQAQLPVLFDSGVRTGSDVVKALCLGAAAVLVGRPYVYGLALGGEEGVRHVLRCLLADFDLAMALSGRATLADLSRDVLVPAP